MPVTPSTARTVVRAANTAGKQVTVTLAADGSTLTGTARFREPGDPQSHTLLLFGVGTFSHNALFGDLPASAVIDLGSITAVTQASAAADPTLGTVLLTPLVLGAPLSPAAAAGVVGPGSPAVSSTFSERGVAGTPYRSADPAWTYGTGTE